MTRIGQTLLVAAAALFLVAVAGCDETRFVGVKTQLDTFSQDGEDVVDFFTQEGTSQVDTFEQNGFHQVDAFEQKASAEVDILWVVDNSASMFEEQTNLANNCDSFINYIQDSLIDYHIGVISTEMEEDSNGNCLNAGHCGQLQGNPKFIDRNNPNPVAAFASNVMVGTDGGGHEMGILAAHMALTEPLKSGANTGFLRDNASLAVIFVSDEDDHSYGELNYYVRFFGSFKGIGNENDVIVAAIVGDVPDGCATAQAGEVFHELVTDLGGTTASICDADFSAALEQLGLTVAGLTRKYVLSREPDPGEIIVRVDEDGDGPGGFIDIPECAPDCINPVARNWRVELAEKAIYFVDYVPPPGSFIQVEYSNVDTVFPLSSRGDQSTIVVMVDEDGAGPGPAEEKQENSDWWYDSDSNAVVFIGDYVPPLGSVIEVSYSDLMRTFALSRAVENAETLRVEVDLKDGAGWRTIFQDAGTGWMYHAGSNSILFQGAYVPPYGSELRVTYSNLLWIFPLSLVPQVSTLVVLLDTDGDGPLVPQTVPTNDDSKGVAGYVYYGPGEPAPYTNAISFEKIDWPPLHSVVTVRYSPGS
ncbi:MAG TPA: hypothetical protein VM425_01500 [Myxococcota bacterium]|nr:hypothetical protein [Myxococcota bacterium]